MGTVSVAVCEDAPLLIEGPTPTAMPDVHPHSVEGALVSIAAMWRVPVLHASDSEQSVRMLRFLADQVREPQDRLRRQFDRKPKRLTSRRLFLLQGLPGVGPTLADRLLCHFGSIERIVIAETAALTEVRGVGAKKAAHIRELVADCAGEIVTGNCRLTTCAGVVIMTTWFDARPLVPVN